MAGYANLASFTRSSVGGSRVLDTKPLSTKNWDSMFYKKTPNMISVFEKVIGYYNSQ